MQTTSKVFGRVRAANRTRGLATSLIVFFTLVLSACGGGAGGSSSTGQTTLPVPTLQSVAVTPTNPTIAKTTSQQFAVTGTYSDNSTKDLTTSATWSSSAASVASVGSSTGSYGLASALAAGTSTITASVGSVSGTTTLTVSSATVVSIAVTPMTASIEMGGTQQYTATGTFSDNSTQDLTTLATWESSDTGVASVSNAASPNGLATGATVGSTTISAAFNGVTGTANLAVTAVTLSSIAVTPANPSVAVGTAEQFTATGTYSDSSTKSLTTTASWTSAATSVATISNASGTNGHATTLTVGTSTITATVGGVSGSTTLTVTSATIVSIAVTPANPSVIAHASQQFTATGTYSDNSAQNITTTVTWSSSKTSVGTISNAAGSNGLLTAVAAGTSTITATSGSVSGHTTLTVPVTYSISGEVTVSGGTTPLAGVTLSLTGGATTSTSANGDYTFNGLSNGSYTVTPALGGYSFAPTSLAVSVSGANITGKNFSATNTGCTAVSDAQSGSFTNSSGQVFSATSPDGIYTLPGGVLNVSNTSNLVSVGYGNQMLVSVGPVCGVGGITTIPTTGYSTSLTVQTGYGYVSQVGDGSYLRFYVTSTGSVPGVGTVIDIQYEYPSTICPTGARMVLTPSGYTFNGVASTYGEPVGTGTTLNYPFVGCAGTANVKAWGAGGAGGQGTISYYGGNGGGGGGGGGYGSENITMVPGQWYVLSVGIGGPSNYEPPVGNGGTSGFGVEAATNQILISTGGQQGTDAGGGTTVGVGGAAGSSNGTIASPGGPGGNGVSNYNNTLCGGGGSTGPAGAGGVGGGGGGAGGSGGCSPGVPSPPGGGGSGVSEYGGGTNGAQGQVEIDW